MIASLEFYFFSRLLKLVDCVFFLVNLSNFILGLCWIEDLNELILPIFAIEGTFTIFTEGFIISYILIGSKSDKILVLSSSNDSFF